MLKKINILNYKNIAEAELSFSDRINCFVGSNGEGKTNVLDAIYFLSFTKSATNSVDSTTIRHGEEFMMLQGLYEIDGNDEEIYCGLKSHQKKRFRRNKKEYKKLSEHIGFIPLIIVSPNDSALIAGGSDERRKFMDVVISQYDNDYLHLLVRYNKALQQRNALLKMEEEPDLELMKAFEEVMADAGERIYEKRCQFIEKLVPVFQKFYTAISGDQEQVGLEYISHCQRGPLLDVIQRDRFKDRAIGYSLHGVHKDELEMTLGGYPIKREGSQGQNKTYLISLKLAQFDFLKEKDGRKCPLLLLDDIFDKLDSKRVEQIIRIVGGGDFGQIFITDTNRENLDKILERSQGQYKIFTVCGGRITDTSSTETTNHYCPIKVG